MRKKCGLIHGVFHHIVCIYIVRCTHQCLCMRLQHLRHCRFSFVSRYSLMRIGCPHPNMVLRSISSWSDSWSSRVKTIDECFLLPMWSDLQSHLGCSFNLIFANHGLSAYSVSRMCVIECGEGFSSQVEIPVSTPSIMIRGVVFTDLLG
jgi:hypothetical protein